MNRRDEITYVARLGAQAVFGASLMAGAYVRRRVREVKDKVFPR